MPRSRSSSWKTQASLLLSRLRSKRAAAAGGSGAGSSLVVQAGFPTSLADLYVKNRSKILPKKFPKPVINPNTIKPIPLPPISIPSADVSSTKTTTTRTPSFFLGFGLVAAGALGVIAIGSKLAVFVITVMSLLLLALENKMKEVVVERVIVLDDSVGRGLVSLIREEESSVSGLESNKISEVSENKEKKKKRKMFTKFFKRKGIRKTEIKVHSSVREVNLDIDDDDDDVEFLSFEEDLDSEEIVVEKENVGINNLRKWSKFVFLVVVLIGLLGGKIFAVVLCMGWILLISVWNE